MSDGSAIDLVASMQETAEATKQIVVANGRTAMQGYKTPAEWKGFVQRIAEMQTPEEAAAAAEDMTLLESLLKHAHEYGNKATEYCILEARMYARIASLYKGWSGDEKEAFRVTASTKAYRIVEWINEKNDDDLAWVFDSVSKGRRIDAVRRDEMATMRKMTKQNKYAATAKRMVDSFKQHGETTINIESFCDSFVGRGEVDAKTACVWIDHARKEVRKLGGVGLGSGDGKYVAIAVDSEAKRRDMAMAILNRLRSIERDLNRMGEICSMTSLEPPTCELRAIIRAAEAMMVSAVRKELAS